MIGKYFRPAMEDDGKKRSYYSVYTIVFWSVAFLCFSWYLFSGYSTIWEDDGWEQHFVALVYYAKYLRGIIRHLVFDHQLIIPEWDFYIGEGTDIINAFHYYVIGDPLTLLSVFVPTRYMHYFFSFSCILRLYLAGISFSILCFGMGQKNRYGIMAGSIAYSFCYWALYNATRHPYFLNPLIYFPLMILGIEKIIRKERPYLFIASAAISAASNFYFFYIIALLAILYTLIRLGFLYKKDIKQGILTLLHLGVMAVAGVCVAGVLLVPVLMMFLGDSRLSVSQPFRLFYPMIYYSQLPALVVSGFASYWTCMGYAAPVVLGVFTLFIKKKEDLFLKVLVVICLVIIIIPICGRVLNGMSYMSNRWSWAFALLCSYILVKKWDDMLVLPRKEWNRLVILSVAFYACCVIAGKSHLTSAFSSITIFFIALIAMRTEDPQEGMRFRKHLLLLGIVVLGVSNIAYWKFSQSDYIEGFKENQKIPDEWTNNEAVAIASLSDSDYTRFSGQELTRNFNILNEVSSTQYFWTISNPYVNNFRSALDMREPMFFNIEGYDDRTVPTALSAVQYYAVKGLQNPEPADDQENSADNQENTADDQDNTAADQGDSTGDRNTSSNTAGKKKSSVIPFGFSRLELVNTDQTQETRLEELREELGVEVLSDVQRKSMKMAARNLFTIYKNNYSLPIAYCYDAYITKEKWDSFDPVQKQEAQLDAAYVDAELSGIKAADLQMKDYHIPYEIECDGLTASQTANSIVTTSANAEIVLKIDREISGAEVYVGFKGLEFAPTAEYDLYFGDESVDPQNLYNKTNWEMLPQSTKKTMRKDKFYGSSENDAEIIIKSSAGTEKTLEYLQPESFFSSGRHDFIVNLGYLKEPVTSITIRFPKIGVYSFDSLSVYGISMDQFPAKIGKLQQNVLQDITVGNDMVTGSISLAENKLMCLATPFSDGWEAYIDDRKTEVYCLNERYPGIVVPAGDHAIRFEYHMAYREPGCILSLLGIIGVIVVVFCCERKRRFKK